MELSVLLFVSLLPRCVGLAGCWFLPALEERRFFVFLCFHME